MNGYKINNLPASLAHAFVVARYIDGELWYWGNYPTAASAEQAAEVCGGLVIPA